MIFFQPINGTKIKLLLINFTNDEISDIRNADVNLVETIIFGDYLTYRDSINANFDGG